MFVRCFCELNVCLDEYELFARPRVAGHYILHDHPEGLVLVSGDFNPTSTGITELTTKRVMGLTQIIKVLTRDTDIRLASNEPLEADG